MPKFKWIASDNSGKKMSGESFALSDSDLKNELLKQNLVLDEFYQVDFNSFLSRVSLSSISNFFYSLQSLISSGVRLHQALDIISVNTKNSTLKDIVFDLSYSIKQGISFYDSIKIYRHIFGDFAIQIIQASQEAGDILSAISTLNEYLALKESFFKKLKSSLVMPLFSFLFFIAGIIFIFVYLIPSLKDLTLVNEAIGQSSYLFRFSDFIQGVSIWQLFTFLFLILSLYVFLRTRLFVSIFIYVPFVSYLYKIYFLLIFLKFNALMLKNGVSLLNSLEFFASSISSSRLKNIMHNVIKGLKEGKSFSFMLNEVKYFPHDIVSMVEIAQESGDLSSTLSFASDIYQKKLQKYFVYITNLMQPVLFIILGVLILVLISSVYLPILNISTSISI